MNDEFSARQGENEEASTEIRRPIRRARRTVAPFSELGKNDAMLEKELCTTEEEPAPALPLEEAEIAEEAGTELIAKLPIIPSTAKLCDAGAVEDIDVSLLYEMGDKVSAKVGL